MCRSIITALGVSSFAESTALQHFRRRVEPTHFDAVSFEVVLLLNQPLWVIVNPPNSHRSSRSC